MIGFIVIVAIVVVLLLFVVFRDFGGGAERWVAGEGPQTGRLRRRAGEGVTWLGRISDLERGRRLRGATVFCAPARSGESFGMVLVEAMAAGTPLVATDIDGYRNVARLDREAVLVPSDDPEALRAALRRVLDDRNLAARLVEAGRLRADELSMDRLAGRFLSIYESVLAPAPAR